MDVISYSETRANLKDVLDRVVNERAPIIVSRKKAEAVVMISLADWNSIEETLHLLSNAVNAARLRASLDELEQGQGQEQALIEV